MDFLEALDFQTNHSWHYYREEQKMPTSGEDCLCVLRNSDGQSYIVVLTLGMMQAYEHILYAWMEIPEVRNDSV